MSKDLGLHQLTLLFEQRTELVDSAQSIDPEKERLPNHHLGKELDGVPVNFESVRGGDHSKLIMSALHETQRLNSQKII